jgi:hypothetical protein
MKSANPTNQSINRSLNGSLNQQINGSLNQQINQSVGQLINRCMDGSIIGPDHDASIKIKRSSFSKYALVRVLIRSVWNFDDSFPFVKGQTG